MANNRARLLEGIKINRMPEVKVGHLEGKNKKINDFKEERLSTLLI